MKKIVYIDRISHKVEEEKVYGEKYIHFLYGKKVFRKVAHFLAAWIGLSIFYGWIQKSFLSRKKIIPFIQKFHINTEEFLDSVDSFSSFNHFFIRKLKTTARPIIPGDKVAVLPADARYLVYPDLSAIEGIWVKGNKLSLEELLGPYADARRYAEGSLVIARLAPVDYHRFHFPVDCTPSPSFCMGKLLHSVNPQALKENIRILSSNKRALSILKNSLWGDILYIEVGALFVGAIHQTYEPGKRYTKGEEKGFFSFGGSTLLLLFEPGKILFSSDLVQASSQGIEVLGKMGQILGVYKENISG